MKGQEIFFTKVELNGQVFNIAISADVPLSEKEKGKLYFAGHKIITSSIDTEFSPLITGSNQNITQNSNDVNKSFIEKIKQALPSLAFWRKPDKDIFLPDLNDDDLKLLGKEKKKVLLKKNIVERK